MAPSFQFLLKLLALVLLAVLGVAVAGLFVLMDVEDKRWAITRSPFGALWLQWNQGNPILQPALFNGAFIGLATLYINYIQNPAKARATAALQGKAKKKK